MPNASLANHSIPIEVQTSARGVPLPTIEVRVGSGPTVRALLDTGSNGVFVFPQAFDQALPVDATRRDGSTYGNHVVFDGAIAHGPITLGDVVSLPMDFVLIDDVHCTDAAPGCDAGMDGVSGSFPVIVGVGLRNGNPQQTHAYIQSPMPQLGSPTGRFVIGGFHTVPETPGAYLTFEPDVSRFAASSITRLETISDSPVPGAPWFQDRAIPVCVNDYCDVVLLDTGSPASTLVLRSEDDYAALGVDADADTLPSGTVIDLAVAGVAAAEYTISPEKMNARDAFTLVLHPNGAGGVLGRMVFAPYDVLFDPRAGSIGVALGH